MNLQQTVSAILGKQVSVEDAMTFANEQFGVLAQYLRENNPKFPNGFTNWKETYYQFCVAIQNHIDTHYGSPDSDIILDIQESHGQGGLWELADAWTCEFENLHKGSEWDGNYFDEIEDFFNGKINS